MMAKKRKSPTIQKPLIDEETVLRFASAAPVQALEPSAEKLSKVASKQPAATKVLHKDAFGKGGRQVSITISEDLYKLIAKEAADKGRTIEELLKKHLLKRYGK